MDTMTTLQRTRQTTNE